MYTLSAKLSFHIPHANSLKDKRQICRALVDKAQHRFNASIAEVGTQDIIRTMTIGVAIVSGNYSHAQESLENVIRFAEKFAGESGAELTEVEEF